MIRHLVRYRTVKLIDKSLCLSCHNAMDFTYICYSIIHKAISKEEMYVQDIALVETVNI